MIMIMGVGGIGYRFVVLALDLGVAISGRWLADSLILEHRWGAIEGIIGT